MNPPSRSDYHSRPLPTTPDRNYVSGSTRTPNRREPPPIPPYPQGGSGSATAGPDWHPQRVTDDPVRRELEEARARTAQMEKTMRWWSDCTANWREKWSKARDERNRARDECRRLRAELDASTLERSALTKHRDELSSSNRELENQLKMLSSSNVAKVTSHSVAADLSSASHSLPLDSHNAKSASLGSGLNSSDAGDLASQERDVSRKTEDVWKHSEDVESNASLSAELLQQLDEAKDLISAEKREKESMSKALEELKLQLTSVTSRCEELVKSEQEAQSQVDKLKQWKQERVEQMASDLEDDAVSGNDVDKRLSDLRKELERMQAENAQEWALREKLSSEKLVLERENKRLRSEVSRLEEELNERSRQVTTVHDVDLKTIQEELSIKTKELSDLRHHHSRLKKSLQDRTAELEHARSRAEQYEVEVKKLRGRIEELKHELANAEDESDQQASQARKIQRTNEELQQQVDSLTIQVQHLQARLSRSQPSLEISAENSSEDLVANELSENEAGDNEDDAAAVGNDD